MTPDVFSKQQYAVLSSYIDYQYADYQYAH